MEHLGVEVWTSALVSDIGPERVCVRRGSHDETLAARTVLWAAGVQASPLGRSLAKATGADVDRAGRVLVEPDLTLPGQPEIFVIGDLAHVKNPAGQPLPDGVELRTAKDSDAMLKMRDGSTVELRERSGGIPLSA